MGSTCVVGLQWGDEAKGKIVDLLCDQHDVVVRYQGGANAGHTVVARRRDVQALAGPDGHPPAGDRLRHRQRRGDPPAGPAARRSRRSPGRGSTSASRLHVSDRAHVILPYHLAEERLTEESASAADHLGTTRRGIGPCYRDKVGRVHGVRVADLYHPDAFPRAPRADRRLQEPAAHGHASRLRAVRRAGRRRRVPRATPSGSGRSSATRRPGCTRRWGRADGCSSRGPRGRCSTSTTAAIRT